MRRGRGPCPTPLYMPLRDTMDRFRSVPRISRRKGMHALTREDGKEIVLPILLRGTATGYCYGLALVLVLVMEATGLAHRGVSIEAASDRYPDRLRWPL